MPRTLTHSQRRAVVALQRRASMQQAADAAGVDERTVRRWLKGSPLFRNTVQQAQLRAWQEQATAEHLAA